MGGQGLTWSRTGSETSGNNCENLEIKIKFCVFCQVYQETIGPERSHVERGHSLLSCQGTY